MTGRSTLSASALGVLLVVSLLFVQWFGVHLHLYGHQHPFDDHAAPHPAYHTELERAVPDHHDETMTVETLHTFIAKILKLNPNLTFILFVSILFALFLRLRNSFSCTDALCLRVRKFLPTPPVRAPPSRLRYN
ncbi:MAG: hypothetical protein HW380_2921 [Magnetococcales bacterium]|nr:hypothetical protein [Magnetococcales bacterium]HIJ84284.1 hypothetical protein [Magnetococcales bacterium]